MNDLLKFLFSKSKKSLYLLVTVGLLVVSGVNTNANADTNVITIDNYTTTTVGFNGTTNDLNVTKNGSIIVDNNDTSVYTDKLIMHFIVNDGNISTTENNDSNAEAYGIRTYHVTDSNITNSGTIIATADSNGSVADAYGIRTGSVAYSNITNSKNITATADSNGDNAEAYGIRTYHVTDSNITNDGNITATADSNGSDAYAYGIYTKRGVMDSHITNDGNISATADSNGSWAQAAGIYNNDLNNSSITNTNSGNITATADSNGSNAEADAYGIYTHGYVTDSNITNDGNITATADSNGSNAEADAYGIYTEHAVAYSNITNKGNINATAEGNGSDAWAYGIFTNDAVAYSSITNSDNITATAESNDSYAQAVGIYNNDLNNSSITNTNSGNITATADSNGTDAEAEGILDAGFVVDSNITNKGNITATAENNDSNASATGIAAGVVGVSNITNSGSGNITATAESNDSNAFAAGIAAGVVADSNITNNGNITATAEGNGSYVYAAGIATGDVNSSNITNSGTITAKINNDFDKNGYAIFVNNSDSNSTITNTEAGELYGNIRINGHAKVINKGLIALPYNATNAYIGGNLTNSGTIQIGMLTDGNISNTQYSQLEVGGSAVFDSGSVLDVNVSSDSTNSEDLIGETLYDVVSSDNLTVNGLKVTDNSNLIHFIYMLDGNSIDLDIVHYLTILDSTIKGGGNSDAQSAAAELDNIQSKGTRPSDMENFYDKLNALRTDKEIAKAVDSTVSYTAVSNIDISNAIINNVFGVVEHQGYGGLNSGDRLSGEKGLWIQPFGNLGKQNDKNSIHGFDFNVKGIGIGAEGEYSDNAYAGIGFFYNRANVDVNGVDQSSDLDVYSALIYGETPIFDRETKLRYKASVSWQKNDSSRYIASTNETAKADYTSNLYAMDLRIEKDANINDNLLLEPMIGATYKYIHTPSYTENGSDMDLKVDSSNTKRLTTYIGAKAYYQLGETSALSAKMNVGYNAIDDDISIVSAYSAAPNNSFTTNGIDNGRWNYSAAIGYKQQISNRDDINFRYEYYGEGTSYHNNAFSLNYLHRF